MKERNLNLYEGSKKIRELPSVILGSDGIRGVQQTIFEIVTNAIDRYKAGYGDKIIITRHKDNSYTIQDFADGLPCLWNNENKKYNWDIALNKMYGGDNYATTQEELDKKELDGKLGNYGLGLASSQMSSEYMDVIVRKKDEQYILKFKEGRPIDKETLDFVKEDTDEPFTYEEGKRVLKVIQNNDGFTGTSINYKPDIKVFTDINVPSEWIKDKLNKQAMINNGLCLIFNDKLKNEYNEYKYKNINEYLKNKINDGYISDFINLYNRCDECQDSKDKLVYKMDYEIAFAFNNIYNHQEYYHNSSELTELTYNVTTSALEKGITNTIHNYIVKNNLYKNKEKIKFSDISDSLVAVLKTKSTKTSYANQTKLSIDNPFIKTFITNDIIEKLSLYLEENKFEADKIITQMLINMRANDKASKSKLALKKKLSEKISIINKIPNLYEAEEKDPKKRILCICEGKSALSSLLSGKLPKHAIFPLRGKILNCLKASPEAMFNNDVIKNLMIALGCGVEFKSNKNKDLSNFNVNNLRYSKVYIFVDADVDGIGSIMPLLLTMFYVLTPTLIKQGRICICKSPKYEISLGEEEYFAIDDMDLEEIKTKLNYNINKNKIDIHYIKGLSELSTNAMSMCLADDYKNIETITLDNLEKSSKTISLFMQTEVKPRKNYILTHFDEIGCNLD